MAIPTDVFKERTIQYLSKDFQSLKRDLIRFSQAHHSGVFQDFNETSPGMALLEFAAYVGDVLSFYQDRQFEELKRETARQLKNVQAIAKQHGYRPQGKRAARGSQAFFVEVPATTDAQGRQVPDDSYSPVLRKGAQVVGPNGVSFETLDDVFFSSSLGRQVTGSRFDPTSGVPTFFALRREVDIVAGQTKTDTVSVGSFEPFLEVELANPDVIEVESVVDSDGNEWTEVGYLAEETVFDVLANVDPDNDVVPFVLKLVTVPRRFVVDTDLVTGKTKLVFGSGDGVNFDDELVPNLADLALPLAGRRTYSSFPLDPQNFLKTRTMGLSPYNTTLTIAYRVGGGIETNVAPKTIRDVSSAQLDFSTPALNAVTKGNVITSLETINPDKTDGGGPAESVAEIKANEAAFFAAQNRVVTREDYIARVMSLPAKFGTPSKVYVKRNNINSLAMDVHLLTFDGNSHLALASPSLKTNVKSYLSKYRMLTDGVNILDANIINLRCSFGIVAARENRDKTLLKCISVVRDFFAEQDDLGNWRCRLQIGEPILISELKSRIQNVVGVVSVYDLTLVNLFGTVGNLSYSSVRFDVPSNTKNEILYCPEGSIFEVKYTSRDIVGTAK